MSKPDEKLEEGPARGIAHVGKRKPVQAARIAARVARSYVAAPEGKPGVTKLNEGFFALERMRAGRTVKARARVRGKVRGK